MDFQKSLEDDLIIMRPLTEEDFESLYEVAKDPLIWEQHPCFDRYKKEEYSKFFKDSIESKGAFVVVEKSNGKVIGSSRFKKVKDSENAVEVGWSFLSRDKWGGRYNKAMKKLMIDYALENVEHVIFYIGKDNMRSQKAVIKLGGQEIDDPSIQNLVRKKESELTFRIGIDNWKY